MPNPKKDQRQSYLDIAKKKEKTIMSETAVESAAAERTEKKVPRIGTSQVASLLGMSKQSVIVLCKSGSLPHVKVGRGSYRFSQGDIDEFVTNNPRLCKKPLEECRIESVQTRRKAQSVPEGYLTVEEVAERAGISVFTVRAATKDGRLEAADLPGRRKLYLPEVVDAAIDRGDLSGRKGRPRREKRDEHEGLLRLEDAANMAGMPTQSLGKLVRDGKCECIRNGSRGVMWFSEEIIQDLLDANDVHLVPGVDWSSAKRIGTAASELGIDRASLASLCDDGLIGYVRSFSGERMFRDEDIARYQAKLAGEDWEEDPEHPYVTQQDIDEQVEAEKREAERQAAWEAMTDEERAAKLARKQERDSRREEIRAEHREYLANTYSDAAEDEDGEYEEDDAPYEDPEDDYDDYDDEEYDYDDWDDGDGLLGDDEYYEDDEDDADDGNGERGTRAMRSAGDDLAEFSGMVINGVRGRGNVVSVFLSDHGVDGIAEMSSNGYEAGRNIEELSDAVVTLAWPMDSAVSTALPQGMAFLHARRLMENSDMPVLVVAYFRGYREAADVALAGSSRNNEKWFLGDRLGTPEGAVVLDVVDNR